MSELRNYQSFRRQLASRRLGSGYIFVGRESYLADEALIALRDALLTDDFTNFEALPREGEGVLVDEVLHRLTAGEQTGLKPVLAETEEQQAKLANARRTAEGFDYAAYQGREIDIDQVLMQIRTAPFTARRRLVVVRQYNDYRKDAQAKLLQELSRESPTCRLALTAEGGDAALARLIAANDCGKFVIELPDSSAGDLVRMIDAWAKGNRLKVDEGARQLLLEVCGDSLAQLKSELDKIRTALGSGGAVTKDTIRDLAGHWREYEVSEFVDAVVRRNRALALSNLRRLDDWDEEPVKVVVWLAGRFLRMLTYGYGDARLWAKPEIATALRHLAAIDMKLKRGFPEKYYLLESFVIRRTPPVRRPARTG